jgi:hypothetical protein
MSISRNAKNSKRQNQLYIKKQKMRILLGDLLSVKTGYIIQQCNCVTRKAKGLALAIEQRFSYCTVYKDDQERIPGTFRVFEEKDSPKIVCLFAQWAPGIPGKYYQKLVGASDTYKQRLEWFVESLTGFLKTNPQFPLCIPYNIGCGLAGGNWESYKSAIEKLEESFHVEFQVYKLE